MNLQAETLYKAAALTVRAFREHDCAPAGEQAGGGGAKPERDAHGEHAEDARVARRRVEEPERKACKEAVEGDDGVIASAGAQPTIGTIFNTRQP